MEERLKEKNDILNGVIKQLLEISPNKGKEIIKEQGIELEEVGLTNEAPEIDGRD